MANIIFYLQFEYLVKCEREKERERKRWEGGRERTKVETRAKARIQVHGVFLKVHKCRRCRKGRFRDKQMD